MEALVELTMSGAGEARIVKQAMEVDDKPLHKSSFALDLKENVLKMSVKADHLGPLRATINAALREAKVASEAQL
jgi:tRNA threonylcarbamoyladenosine modification (KEOPS) complex  Pcc1 subunit